MRKNIADDMHYRYVSKQNQGNRSVLIKICLFFIRFYQFALRPLFGQHCRFYPSCSQYMFEAIDYFGVFKGVWLGCRRLMRCHPFCEGGVDPLTTGEEKKPYE